MKKAPRRYATGGPIDPTDPKKKKFESTTNSQARQLANAGKLNKTIADTYESQNYTANLPDDNSRRASIPVTGAGGYSVPKEPYQNELGTYVPATGTQYDKAGNVIQPKAKGGMVKKMTKAPCKMKKGGTC